MSPTLVNTDPDFRRRFNIADWLIFTAATASTMAALIEVPDWSHHAFLGGHFVGYLDPPLALQMALKATYVLFPWTVAVFLMGLRRPRPELRILFTRPGMAACGAVTAWLGFKIFLLALMSIGVPQKRFLVARYMGDGVALVSWAAPAVAGAWLVLVLSGHWCPHRGWFDRFGRLLGASWLALEVLNDLRILF
jgi:hypothetical protein